MNMLYNSVGLSAFTILLLAISQNVTFVHCQRWIWNSNRSSTRGTGAFMTEQRRLELRDQAKRMFYYGYENYMNHAFPMDELDPIRCIGVGPDYDDPTNIGINDVRGNYSLTLVDVLDTFVVLGDRDKFHEAVRKVIDHVSFNSNVKVQVFEANIRGVGGLISAHIFASNPEYGFAMDGYKDELLTLAKDLADRLMPAFRLSKTGIPHARVNLKHGLPKSETFESCTAGGGTFLLEFGTLSRLLNDSSYEKSAKAAFFSIWNRRSDLNLVGNGIDVMTGQWVQPTSGIGAGIDSFFEYALKAYILFGEVEYFDAFTEAYAAIRKYVRGETGHIYRNVHMMNANPSSYWVDSLSAFWPGLQVLVGDIDGAIKSHLLYWNIWKNYSSLPERFSWYRRDVEISGYPIRPEFIESTYYLYQATKDPFFLHVGERILNDLETFTKTPCGYASLDDVVTKKLGTRMESFALSESLKYAYLLFDEHNPFNHRDSNFVFTTEGHILELNHTYLKKSSKIRRKLRGIDDNLCPVAWNRDAFAPCMADRRDADYVKTLINGIQDNDEQNPPLHSDGFCEIPLEDSAIFEIVFGTVEDPIPSSKKVFKQMNTLIVNNVDGLRVEFTKRADNLGYAISKVGHHKVLNFQSVIFRDPDMEISWTSKGGVDSFDSVVLHLLWESSPGYGDYQRINAVPALFGPKITKKYAFLPLFLVYYIQDPFLCNKIPPDLYTYFQGRALLVLRGHCTFEEKMYQASKAGADFVIVSSYDNNLTQPSGYTPVDTCPSFREIPLVLVGNETGIMLSSILKKSYTLPTNSNQNETHLDVMGSNTKVLLTIFQEHSQRNVVESVVNTKNGPKKRKFLSNNSMRVLNAFLWDLI